MKEQKKYDVIKEIVDHNGNKKRAALKLDITERQINRLIIKYKENGKSSFVHGNRGKSPAKTLDKSVSEDIILLYKNKYQGFNFRHQNKHKSSKNSCVYPEQYLNILLYLITKYFRFYKYFLFI